jgi:hypothetical protein
MPRILKTVISTLLILLPLLIREMVDPLWRWPAIGGFALFVFVYNLWQFGPDRRFEKIREPTLNAQLNTKFREAREKLRPGQRLPFRVNVMQPGWTWYIWPRLKIVYAYGMERADPDYGLPWTKGRGLCWKVYQTGKVGWFDRGVDDPAQFGLKDRERQATQHVLAILSLPIRSAHRPLHPKPTAVLNIDALSAEAAQALREEKEALEAHNNQALVDLVAFVGLYF